MGELAQILRMGMRYPSFSVCTIVQVARNGIQILQMVTMSEEKIQMPLSQVYILDNIFQFQIRYRKQ